jgi:alpha-glucosidase
MPESAPEATAAWWRGAVIYQVYIRSFADGDGDGVGDIAGLRSRLGHLAALGVDALWITPWYPSPLADAGYDVADYRAIEPRFGTLADAEALVREAHERGIRVILDLVPNHTSSQHAWFQEALAAGPGSAARERYVFRDQPNDWQAMFGGSAWTQVPDGQWYLHLFDPEQPDLNWENPEVREDFLTTLRFWFDRGVDGFRIDVANSLIKEQGLPDVGDKGHHDPGPHPHWDRDEVHDIYRDWRALADTYDPPRVFVAEAWVPEADRFARYLRPDELHTAFNFDFLKAPWRAPALRESVERTLWEHAMVGAPATWVLSNHDVARHVSRLARDPGADLGTSLDALLAEPADLEAGLRRARAAALLIFALPGGAYVYQGDELGLPEVEDLPEASLDDPTWRRSGHTQRGRDGCRVPMPWSGDAPPFGFGPGTGQPWLPQPAWFARFTAEQAEKDPDSMLHLYREALRVRKAEPALGDGPLTWLDVPPGALGFVRDPDFALILNVDAEPFALPEGAEILLTSAPLTPDGLLPKDTAAWLHS